MPQVKKTPDEWMELLQERATRLLELVKENYPKSLIVQEVVLVVRAGLGYCGDDLEKLLVEEMWGIDLFCDPLANEIPDLMWEEFVSRLQECGEAFRQERVEAAALKKQYEKGRSALILDIESNRIVAHATLWETKNPSWFEVGTVWTREGKNRLQLCRLVMKRLFSLIQNLNKLGFLITDNLVIAFISEKSGWRLAEETLSNRILSEISPERNGLPRKKKLQFQIWVSLPPAV